MIYPTQSEIATQLFFFILGLPIPSRDHERNQQEARNFEQVDLKDRFYCGAASGSCSGSRIFMFQSFFLPCHWSASPGAPYVS